MAQVQTLDGRFFEPELPKRLLKIASDIHEAGGRAYLVGGWVRDAMLGGNCRDYDIEVYDMEQDGLIAILSKYGRTNLVGKAFGVIHLSMKGESLDFSFPRTESKVGYGHRGFVVHTDAKLTFREAALRRDFTINAMGMELPDLTLCDPYNGVEDLKAGVLRHVGPAFAEDSLRILRGVQFASRFKLHMAPETVEMCRTLSLSDLSIERLFEEFKKWLLKPGKPSLGLKAFLDIKLDEYFPEVKPLLGSWDALGEMLDNMESVRSGLASEGEALSEAQSMELAFATLLAGNVGAENAVAGIDCSNDAVKFLERITNEIHLLKIVPVLLKSFEEVSFAGVKTIANDAPTLRRLAVKLGGLKLLCLMVKAAPKGFYDEADFPEKLWQAASALNLIEEAPQPFLTGKMLMDMGVKPGKQMGELIKQSFELQLDGEITSVEGVCAWAKGKIA